MRAPASQPLCPSFQCVSLEVEHRWVSKRSLSPSRESALGGPQPIPGASSRRLAHCCSGHIQPCVHRDPCGKGRWALLPLPVSRTTMGVGCRAGEGRLSDTLTPGMRASRGSGLALGPCNTNCGGTPTSKIQPRTFLHIWKSLTNSTRLPFQKRWMRQPWAWR